MAAHPNRSRRTTSPAANPTPEQIRQAREAAGLSQTAAAALVYTALRTWQQWEAANDRRMHPAIWELWQLKVAALKAAA